MTTSCPSRLSPVWSGCGPGAPPAAYVEPRASARLRNDWRAATARQRTRRPRPTTPRNSGRCTPQDVSSCRHARERREIALAKCRYEALAGERRRPEVWPPRRSRSRAGSTGPGSHPLHPVRVHVEKDAREPLARHRPSGQNSTAAVGHARRSVAPIVAASSRPSWCYSSSRIAASAPPGVTTPESTPSSASGSASDGDCGISSRGG